VDIQAMDMNILLITLNKASRLPIRPKNQSLFRPRALVPVSWARVVTVTANLGQPETRRGREQAFLNFQDSEVISFRTFAFLATCDDFLPPLCLFIYICMAWARDPNSEETIPRTWLSVAIRRLD
jgi:hypothetical protein